MDAGHQSGSGCNRAVGRDGQRLGDLKPAQAENALYLFPQRLNGNEFELFIFSSGVKVVEGSQ